MTTIVVDAGMRAKLLAADKAVQFRDEAGNIIRQFMDVANADGPLTDTMDVSDEELDRRERDDRRFTPDQVLDRLRGLRK
jgi:hypothetical protein